MKTPLKIILIIFGSMSAIAAILFIPYLIFKYAIFPGNKLDDNIENYLKNGDHINEYASEVFPDIDNLPEYEDITYQYYTDGGYWVSETMLLVVKYDKQTYEDEKQELNNTFEFLDRNLSFYIPEHEFSINDYTFRVIKSSNSNYIRYPKSFGMIATSDENYSIAYLYYYDIERDLLSSPGEENPMQNFVEEYFQYEW